MKFNISLGEDKHQFKENAESGQALLILLLIMSVILAVVLSVSTKSLSDVSVTTQQKESLRAFSAAEAGVEELLLPGSPNSIPNTSYDTDTTYGAQKNENQAGASYVYPHNLKSGEIATFWFVSHDSYGNLSCDSLPCSKPSSIVVCWEQKSLPVDVSFGAVEVMIYYDTNDPLVNGVVSPSHDSSGVHVKRLFFDPYQTRAVNENNFTYVNGSCTIGTTNFTVASPTISFNSSGTLPIPNYNKEGTILMVKVKMLYNPLSEPQPVGIQVSGGGSALPPQAVTISSTGTSGNSTRKVDVSESYPDVPSVFNTSFFGGGSIVQ